MGLTPEQTDIQTPVKTLPSRNFAVVTKFK